MQLPRIGGIKADESLTNASYFKAGDPISDWMVIVEKRAGLDKNFDEEGYLKNLKKIHKQRHMKAMKS